MAATDTDSAAPDARAATAPSLAAQFFGDSALGLQVVERVRAIVPAAAVGVSKSQVAFRRRRAFAWLWRPRMYLGERGAEVVLSIALPRRDASVRWKQVVQPAPGRWMHHLELRRVEEVDAEVERWLLEAAGDAG